MGKVPVGKVPELHFSHNGKMIGIGTDERGAGFAFPPVAGATLAVAPPQLRGHPPGPGKSKRQECRFYQGGILSSVAATLLSLILPSSMHGLPYGPVPLLTLISKYWTLCQAALWPTRPPTQTSSQTRST